MVDRTRKIVNKPVTSVDIEWSTLESAVKTLHNLVNTYGPNAKIKSYTPQYSDTEYLYVYADEPETDSEMNLRIALEERYEREQEVRDRKEFERLAAKFGGSKT